MITTDDVREAFRVRFPWSVSEDRYHRGDLLEPPESALIAVLPRLEALGITSITMLAMFVDAYASIIEKDSRRRYEIATGDDLKDGEAFHNGVLAAPLLGTRIDRSRVFSFPAYHELDMTNKTHHVHAWRHENKHFYTPIGLIHVMIKHAEDRTHPNRPVQVQLLIS